MTGGSIYILQRESPSHIPLYTICMGRWYTVVLEEKLRKYVLEFKEVKTTTRQSRLRHNKSRTYKILSSKLLFALKKMKSALKCTLN